MSAEPTGVMLTSPPTTAADVQNTFFGFGDQPWLLAHSIIAKPRAHSPVDTYMMMLAGSSPRLGKPAWRPRPVSGSFTGGVAALPSGARPPRPTTPPPTTPPATTPAPPP